jgi:hypothetical protein
MLRIALCARLLDRFWPSETQMPVSSYPQVFPSRQGAPPNDCRSDTPDEVIAAQCSRSPARDSHETRFCSAAGMADAADVPLPCDCVACAYASPITVPVIAAAQAAINLERTKVLAGEQSRRAVPRDRIVAKCSQFAAFDEVRHRSGRGRDDPL